VCVCVLACVWSWMCTLALPHVQGKIRSGTGALNTGKEYFSVIDSWTLSVCQFWLAAGPLILLWFPSNPAQGLVSNGHVLASFEAFVVSTDETISISQHPLHVTDCVVAYFIACSCCGNSTFIQANTSLASICHFLCSWIRASWYISYRKIEQDATLYRNFIIPHLN
jgi:hypothetical protein